MGGVVAENSSASPLVEGSGLVRTLSIAPRLLAAIEASGASFLR